jgi:hypothetical protein
MRDKDELDSLLDRALVTYADPGVAPDLAGRVLASIQHIDGRRRPDKWLPLVVGVAAFAGLLFVTLFLARHAAQPASISPTVELAKPHKSGPAGHMEENKSDAERTTRVVTSHFPLKTTYSGRGGFGGRIHEQAVPRLEVFPAPAPLTVEERALATLVSQSSGDISQSIADRQKNAAEPVRIAAIQIQPINPPVNGEN